MSELVGRKSYYKSPKVLLALSACRDVDGFSINMSTSRRPWRALLSLRANCRHAWWALRTRESLSTRI